MSRSAAATVAVVLLVVLAGCTASLDEVRPDVAASDGTTPEADAAAATNATADGPWGTDPVVVAVAPVEGRDVVPLVREATQYWEAHAETYAGYAVDYTVDPDAESPDVVVEFPERIDSCARSHNAAGCAPYITSSAQIQRPVTVEVKAGLSDDSTVTVLRHEFGHTLGLSHDDDPQDVMAESAILTTLPQPNATERAFPWRDAEFTVYVDVDAAEDPRRARQQVRHAFDYYEAGAEGMPSNLSFEYVDDPDADIVVEYVDDSACAGGSGSCSSTTGIDPDGDDAIELYTSLRITLTGLDTDVVGWHVGYWLASGFGAEDDADKPEPFRDASREERRSEWWRR